ncbi:MAG: AAA family ATPase [Proteobacteria bacterium]|nr:AAA family ATPase [Pseudomonadota bacterium]
MTIEINEQFAQALKLMEGGRRNLFVTGKAGTGKSTLLSYFREHTKRQVVVVAPTGVAAVNVGAQTLHSFFGFKPDVTVEKARRAAKKALDEDRARVYREMDTLIIDEVSMVRADLFDCADAFLRVARGSKSKPFGGVSVVLIGDLYQLPPVVAQREREIFTHHYRSPFFFDSNAYPEMGVEILELEKIYRQHDDEFIAILNAVRNNTIDEAGIAELNGRVINGKDADGSIYLTALNREADEINEEKLAKLKGRARGFEASVSGSFDEKSYPADRVIRLKRSAQVMLLNNDSLGRWINGTIGTVVGMDGESVSVKLADGSVVDVVPHTWRMFRFDMDHKSKRIISEPVGKFTQLPVMLAWAVTIHKSQGKTFDSAVIDAGRAFAAGQVYVALSRLRTIEGMRLARPLKKSHVRVDWRVVKFLTAHRYTISERQMPLDEKVAMIEGAIRERRKLEIVYLKSSDVKSRRVIRPLEVGEMFYGDWTFLGVRGVCDLRGEERNFRVDRILDMKAV